MHKQGAKCVFRVDFLRGEELQYFLRMPKLWCLRSDQGPFCKTGKGGQMTSEGLHSQLAVKLRRETASHAAKSATWSALPLHSTALPLALSVDRSPNHKVKIWHEIWSLRAFRLISYCTGIQQAFSVTNKKKKAAFFQMHPADMDAIADEKCCFVWFLSVSFPGRSQMARVMQTKWIIFCLEQRKSHSFLW